MNFKKLIRIIFGRSAVVILALLAQILFFVLAVNRFREAWVHFYTASIALSLVIAIFIINGKSNPSFKMTWLLLALAFPFFGTPLYIYTRIQLESRIVAKRLDEIIKKTKKYISADESVLEEIKAESPSEKNLAAYISGLCGYPPFKNTSAEYMPSGEAKFKLLKEELSKAERFIFLEYFIIERGVMWDGLLEILSEKASAGVEVRVMYDGMCSLALLPWNYPKRLHKLGIQCKVFSQIRPVLSTVQNNRDHRKIAVIDGHTAFTGGVNIADEYINERERFGHWKDTALMLKGEAANSFTMMFLQNWNLDAQDNGEDYEKYLCRNFSDVLNAERDTDGFFIPYGDSPLDHELTGHSVYSDILYRAEKYVHITTPYLVPDNEMLTALKFAAKRSVETVIILPHIPDKRYAYLLARTYYAELIRAGVKIYEYTPGFIHAKMFISDDIRAAVGTINIDFRSLYLHFECAAYCYGNSVVNDIEKDFQDTLKGCTQITLENCRKYNYFGQLAGWFLRLIAPLM